MNTAIEIKRPLFRRRQYLIKRDFQFRYIGLLIGITCLVCLVFAFASRYYINLNINPLIESGLVTSPVASELAQIEKQFLNKNLLAIFLALIGTLSVVGIFITHRIAGPIYALERRMKQIAKEGITQSDFRIRRTDEFQEVAEAFNEMIASLQKQIQGYEETSKKAQENKMKKAA